MDGSQREKLSAVIFLGNDQDLLFCVLDQSDGIDLSDRSSFRLPGWPSRSGQGGPEVCLSVNSFAHEARVNISRAIDSNLAGGPLNNPNADGLIVLIKTGDRMKGW
jgi:hypothetical protein